MAGTTAHSMMAGIIVFFLAEIYALSVAVFGGSILDILEATFNNAGMYNIAGDWGADACWWAYDSIINVFYFSAYAIAILGVIVLIVTIWHRHGSDDEDDDYNNQYNL